MVNSKKRITKKSDLKTYLREHHELPPDITLCGQVLNLIATRYPYGVDIEELYALGSKAKINNALKWLEKDHYVHPSYNWEGKIFCVWAEHQTATVFLLLKEINGID